VIESASPLTVEQDFLAHAAEDWMSAAEALGLALRSGLTEPGDLRDLTVGILGRLLLNGLLVAGEIGDGSFAPWRVSTAEAIARIIRQWSDAPDPMVMPGEIAWFDTTPRGQALGESYWRNGDAE